MSAKYSPGPWKLVEDRIYSLANPSHGIAFMAEGNRVDAYLIAAAPELLAAAMRARDWIEVQMQEMGWPLERVKSPPEGSHLHALNAAIAKAQGETK